MSEDPFDLERFVSAQFTVFDDALAELTAGRKRTHWMWFIFPQMRGLGHSSMAQRYGIGSLAEARAYLAHPLLGERLLAATDAALAHGAAGAHTLFGSPDDMKFRSSMTLFACAGGEEGRLFRDALAAFYDGQEDAETLRLLERP
ncbi:DUF1810 domain-containing protein [Azorhizobium oxalatiphilum]|nr:DUF1810 domain-containing protein [Azorhizobium oxalatiphilum]